MWKKWDGPDSEDPGRQLLRDAKERAEWARLNPQVLSYSHRVETTTLTVIGTPTPASPSPLDNESADWSQVFKTRFFHAAVSLTSALTIAGVVIEEVQRQFPLLREHPTPTTVGIASLLGAMTLSTRRLFRR